MITYIVRRLLLLIPLLVAVSMLSFGIMVMAPGNYVDTLRQNPQIKAETIKRFEINYGFKDRLGKPIAAPRRYIRWLVGGCTPGESEPAPVKRGIRGFFQRVSASIATKVNWYYCTVDVPVNERSFSAAALSAEQSVPGGIIKSAKLKRNDGNWLYSFNIATGDHFKCGALCGNLGESMEFHQPVLGLIGHRAMATFLLALCATLIAWILAIPLGILSATRQYSFTDMGLTVVGFLGLSIPSVVSSLVFLLIAAKSHFWIIQFPTGDMHRLDADDYGFFWRSRDLLWHLILPSFALGVISIAPYMRQMRGQMLEVLNADYIRTARSKGLNDRTVIWKHAVRNAINPMITLFGYSLASLLSGSFVIEIVMNWPGLAPLTLNAIQKNDVTLVMADLLIAAFLLVLGNLIADLMLAWADPRIKLA